MRKFLALTPLLACLLAGPARAQETGVSIAVDTFGAGGMARGGDWCGVRLAVEENGDAVRDCLITWELPDPDGDTRRVQRRVTLTPGVTTRAWLYARLPNGAVGAQTFRAWTVIESAGGASPGALLAETSFNPSVGGWATTNSQGLAAVIGPGLLGLGGYDMVNPRNQPLTTHENLISRGGVRLADLPDSWVGLKALEALVWSGRDDPSNLSAAQAQAVREYVASGGHLIICSTSPAWRPGARHGLSALLPELDGAAATDVPYRLVDPVLGDAVGGKPATVQALLMTPDTDSGTTKTILALADGRPFVVRRLYGAGRVTVVGLDLQSRVLQGRVDPEAFWQRILGRRGALLTQDEYQRLQSQNVAFTISTDRWSDENIASAISKAGKAGVGVLLGLAAFSLYLLIAGPGSYALLSKMKQKRHAWTVFVACAAVFTVGTWGASAALRPGRADATHLTVLRHVYGASEQLARSWMSVLAVDYGTAEFSVSQERGGRGAIAPWGDPASLAALSTFPDSREYAVDGADPGSFTAPTRSTVKQIVADWAGPPNADWGSMPRPGPEGVRDDRGVLSGTLAHGLPGALTNVRIMHVQAQRPLGALPRTDEAQFFALAYTLDGEWAPGVSLDLATLRGNGQPATAYFKTLARRENVVRQVTSAGANFEERLEMWGWYPALHQPDWSQAGLAAGALRARIKRREHGLDLGPWFGEPCMIVVGLLEEVASPVPLELDGRAVPTQGRVMVQWVYPLPANPPRPAGGSGP